MARNNPAQSLDNQQARTLKTYQQRARALSRDNQVPAAIQTLKQALALAPNNAALNLELGKLYIKNRQMNEGVRQLEETLEIDPYFVPALIELGQTHSKHDNLGKAQPLLETALEQAPELPATNLAYGALLQKQGKLAEAIDHFRRALRARLDHPTKQYKKKLRDDFDKPATEQLMWDTLSQLARAGVHAFACYGTLLGVVREGGLLPFDKDIDFGIPLSEMDKATQCLRSRGWLTAHPSITNPRAFFHPRKSTTLDLSGFVVDPETQQTYSGFWMANVAYENGRNARYPPVKLAKARSPDNQPIWQLSEPEAWLESLYGDWRTPDPYFDTVVAAKNLCGFSQLTQCYAFSRIFSNWDEGKLLKSMALVEHAQRHLPNDELLQDVKNCLESVLHN